MAYPKTARHAPRSLPTALDLPVKVAEIWKNRGRNETVRVSLSRYKERDLIDIRQFFTDADGCMRPTAKDVALAVHLLPAIAAALVKAETKARELGLLDARAGE